MNFIESDLSIGMAFFFLSLLLLALTIVLIARKNNWWWGIAGLIPSMAITLAGISGDLEDWLRPILLAFWVFAVLHVTWNLVRNLKTKGLN